MKVVLLSKALVHGAYQTKCEAIAREPDVDLTVIVPPSWHEIGGWETRLERRFTAGYELIETPLRFNGHHHVHYYPELGGLLTRIRPDVFHVDEEAFNFATFHAMWLGRKVGARLAFYTWANIHRWLPPPYSLFERAAFGWSARAFAGNHEAERILLAKGYRRPIDRLPQFGVDLDLFRPPADRPTRPVTIGYYGRFTEAKGLAVLLQAAARLTGDWRLVLVGAGEFEPTIRATVGSLELGERTSLRGPVGSADVPALLHEFDVVVLPSLTRPGWKEQFGRVLIEAMASGVPVVGSDSGEIPHVIGTGGLVTAEGDAVALAAALQRLVDSPAERQRLAAAGHERVVHHYAQAALARRYVDAYRAMLTHSA